MNKVNKATAKYWSPNCSDEAFERTGNACSLPDITTTDQLSNTWMFSFGKIKNIRVFCITRFLKKGH
jgi:hypothetical protein